MEKKDWDSAFLSNKSLNEINYCKLLLLHKSFCSSLQILADFLFLAFLLQIYCTILYSIPLNFLKKTCHQILLDSLFCFWLSHLNLFLCIYTKSALSFVYDEFDFFRSNIFTLLKRRKKSKSKDRKSWHYSCSYLSNSVNGSCKKFCCAKMSV